jgi:ribosome-associated protein
MIKITSKLNLDEANIKFNFVRSSGPGGQNVNKVATAVLLRFKVSQAVSLPDDVRLRLQEINRNKLNHQGELLIKASRFRTQERNKQDALNRLIALIKQAALPIKQRKKTKPNKGAVQERLNKKKRLGKKKSMRQNQLDDE